MEIYRALCDYTPISGALNVLSFCKGEQFEVLEDEKTHKEWWGARRLQDNTVGYIPAKYMKYHERRVGKLFTDIERKERDIQLQKLEEMQNQQERNFPEPIDLDIPEPDYDDTDIHNGSTNSWNGSGKPQGLIEPKKLLNPCKESPQKQELHKELLMNTKMGIDVLKKKPELQRELERRRESQKKREWELYKEQKKTGFERKLEEQANKIKMQEEQRKIAAREEMERPEFLKVHDKIRTKSQS